MRYDEMNIQQLTRAIIKLQDEIDFGRYKGNCLKDRLKQLRNMKKLRSEYLKA